MKLMKTTASTLFFAFALFSCGSQQQETTQETASDPLAGTPTLSQAGDAPWAALFDGTSLDQWRNYRADTISGNWSIDADGNLTLTGKGGGDIITKNQYQNFVLELEWKISEGGNSGIFFNVIEADTLPATYFSGPEFQILDDERHSDAKIHKHQAGDNYDLHASTQRTVKPAGEWNMAKLKVNNGKVEQWLNGVMVVEYELWTKEWEDLVNASKFGQWPTYGRAKKGHIALQDHGDQVWFRNIRIREL